jgi:hypothetical protein
LTPATTPTLGVVNVLDSEGHKIRHRSVRPALLSIAASLSSCLLDGCSGSPSRNILGSYFPSWMVCALIGLATALVARAVLKALGVLHELPAPLVVLLSIGCAVTFALWLTWLA